MEPYDLADLEKTDYIITPIEFSSTTTWKAMSDKIWVLFSTTEDGEYYNDIMGAAGVHKIYMKILILTGSPKGKYSCTLHTLLYIERIFENVRKGFYKTQLCNILRKY